MGEQIPVTQARAELAELAELVNRVAYAGERIELTRHGKLVAALVSAADYQRLQDTGQVRSIGFTPPSRPRRSCFVDGTAGRGREPPPADTNRPGLRSPGIAVPGS